jgi:hypothetical protein
MQRSPPTIDDDGSAATDDGVEARLPDSLETSTTDKSTVDPELRNDITATLRSSESLSSTHDAATNDAADAGLTDEANIDIDIETRSIGQPRRSLRKSQTIGHTARKPSVDGNEGPASSERESTVGQVQDTSTTFEGSSVADPGTDATGIPNDDASARSILQSIADIPWPAWLQHHMKTLEGISGPPEYQRIMTRLAMMEMRLGFPTGQVMPHLRG